MNTKNIKTKIILSAIIFLSVVGFIGIADAIGASLYVSPASLTKIAGNTFSVSVGFNASGSKVCAVEGTLVFSNLSCQSITVAGDVMAQSSPTCSNSHFLIGIPSCTILDKILLTVSVRAGNAGAASIGATGVDIIGEGVSVGSASINGNYTINAIATPIIPPSSSAPAEKTPVTPAEETPVAPAEEVTPPPAEETPVAPAEETTPTSSPALFDILTQPEAKQSQRNLLIPILFGVGIFMLVIAGYIIYRKRM